MDESSRRRWRFGRCAYRASLVGWFLLVAFRVGPDWFNYRRLTHPDPADYVDLVNTTCAPVLRGAVAYRRDTGRDPNGVDDLVPKYLPPYKVEVVWFGRRGEGAVFPFFDRRLRVSYQLANGVWVWRIEGPALDGIVPAPPVTGYPPPEPDDSVH